MHSLDGQVTYSKKCSEETQTLRTLRAGCSKAETKNISPPQTPFPGAWDG